MYDSCKNIWRIEKIVTLGILGNYDSGSYHLDGTLIKDLTEKQAAESACYSPILKKLPPPNNPGYSLFFLPFQDFTQI